MIKETYNNIKKFRRIDIDEFVSSIVIVLIFASFVFNSLLNS